MKKISKTGELTDLGYPGFTMYVQFWFTELRLEETETAGVSVTLNKIVTPPKDQPSQQQPTIPPLTAV